MNPVLTIVAAEWNYWRQSKVLIISASVFFVLIAVTAGLVQQRIASETHIRTHHQKTAEETFINQPDRHPHRMVHYGHYVFRTPTPLAVFDPGIDSAVGQSMFLEGHRQNTAMFPESASSADLGSYAWLTPALVYQLFAPLLLLLIGHESITRERESKTLAVLFSQGISGYTLVFSKLLALLSLVALLLFPLLAIGFYSVLNGESALTVLTIMVIYGCYLGFWAVFSLMISVLIKSSMLALVFAAMAWLTAAVLFPTLSVAAISAQFPINGKIETDFLMQSEVRKAGDGHNTNDPAFKALKQQMLSQYSVDSIDQLPFNFKGMVAAEGERKLSEIMNEFSNKRFNRESLQEKSFNRLGWFSPTIALAFSSRALSGTDLDHYHRFLKEAEKTRYDFVQALNKAHLEQLSYHDDMNRNKNEEGRLKARVDAANWQQLDNFEFTVSPINERLVGAIPGLTMLNLWLLLSLIGLFWSSTRLRP